MRKLITILVLGLSINAQLKAQTEFITTWQATGADPAITIPTTGSGYNYNVDWGDGDTSIGVTGLSGHQYDTPGVYTVTITGTFPRIHFNNNSLWDPEQLVSIEQWGTTQWISMQQAFYGCNNLVINATDVPDLSNVTSMGAMFRGANNLVDNGGKMKDWNTSNVNNMGNLFRGASSFNEDIGNWDVSSVTNFGGMFEGASSFNQDIGLWDIGQSNGFINTFNGATAFSSENYNNLLNGWASLNVGETQIPTNIDFTAPATTYCLGADKRNTLDTTYNWNITGDTGVDCSGTSDLFITTWQTTTANESITIPTHSDATYNYTVDWGDGTIETNQTGDATHSYATAGTHTVTISGSFPRIFFNNDFLADNTTPRTNGSKDKILTIEQWGTQQWIHMGESFYGCSNLKLNATDTPDFSGVTTMNLQGMFYQCTNLEDLQDQIGQWDVSNVNRMYRLFSGCTLFNEDISGWNVSNVQTFLQMFINAAEFNQNIGGWNTSSVTTMGVMFAGASKFNQDLSGWDVSNVTIMNSMFSGAEDFNSDISGWTVSSVERMDHMFSGATSFNQDLSGWDISSMNSVTNQSMKDMFTGATSFSSENYNKLLIGWSTDSSGNSTDGDDDIPSNITFGEPPTAYCEGALARGTLDTTYNWTFSGAASEDCSEAFITTWQVSANESITIPTTGSGYDYVIDWGDGTFDANQTGDASHTYTSANTYTIKIVGDFPRIYFNNSGDKDKILSIEQWGSNQWSSMLRAFNGCSNLVLNADDSPDLSRGGASMLTLAEMFSQATNFVDNKDQIGNWDVSNVNNLFRTFYLTNEFNEDLSGWDVSGVFSFLQVFSAAAKFDQDLGSWDISSGTNFSAMFQNSGLSRENYDKLLIGWASLDSGETQIPTDVIFGAPPTTYCLGLSARNELDTTYNWTISNDTEDCSDAFITTWQVSANETITIPTFGSGYDYFIDWGDGTNFDSNQTGDATHTYTSGGTYTIKISGNFPRIRFNNSGNKDNIRTIEQWGDIQWSTMARAFMGCSNLVLNADDSPDLSRGGASTITLNEMFAEATNLVDNKDQIGNWDVSNVSTLYRIFYLTNEFNEDLSGWNVSGVSSFLQVFSGAAKFDQDLGSWDISSGTNFSAIFEGTNLSRENYDKLLIGWSTDSSGNSSDGDDDIPAGITFGAPPVGYCFGATALNTLTSTYSWNLTNDQGEDCSEAFITTWQTTATNESITIPTFSGDIYNYTIDWGDDTVEQITTDVSPSHTYTAAGTHTIKIFGAFPRIRFNNSGDKDKIRTIEQWGSIQWSTMSKAFMGCSNLVLNADDSPDLSRDGVNGVSMNLQEMFQGCTNLEDLQDQIGQWDVSNVNRMYALFSGCTLFNEDISGWNVSGVDSFLQMFVGAEVFNQNIGGWTTSIATNMGAMFAGAKKFNQDLSGWNVSNVTQMNAMFQSTDDFNGDISGWTVSLVARMDRMFQNATSFNQDLSGWDISSINSVTDQSMAYMFNGATSFSVENYDKLLAGWSIDSSGNPNDGDDDIPIGVIFGAPSTTYCTGSTGKTILTNTPYNWTISGDTGLDCNSVSFITTWETTTTDESITIPTQGGGYLYRIDWGDGTVDENVTGSATHTYTNAGTHTVAIAGNFPRIYFNNAGDKDKIQTIEQWGTIAWSSMEDAFRGCINLELNAPDSPDLSNVSSLEEMFSDATALVDLQDQIGNWNVSNINRVLRMFANAVNFNEDIGGWNTSEVIIMGGIFMGATAFNQDISEWDVSKVTSFGLMFFNAAAFNQDISSWNFNGLITNRFGFQNVFNGATSFSTENYDNLLIGLARLDPGETQIPPQVIFSANTLSYCEGNQARTDLITNYSWNISGDSIGCNFETTWQTTTADESITIPTTGSGYNYTIDWGDGTIETNQTSNATHTYATAGNHRVKISGDFPRIYFNNGGDKDKILSIDRWGDIQWASMEAAFFGCSNVTLEAPDTPDLSIVTSMESMFNGATALVDNQDVIGTWNVSTIQNISNLFFDATNFNEAIGSWNTSSVTNMANMFNGATSFNQDLSNWDLSSINTTVNQSMTNMFSGATGFSSENYEQLLIGWSSDSSGSTNDGIDDVPTGVTFGAPPTTYCTSSYARTILTNAPNNWIIIGDTECSTTFITTWQTTAADESITIPTEGTGYDYTVDWGDGTVDYNQTSNATHSYATAGTHTIRISGDFPRIHFNNSGDKDKIFSIEQWGDMEWTSMEHAFYGCANLVLNATDTPDLSQVTNMYAIFFEASSFVDNGGSIGTWNTTNVQQMGLMFGRTPMNSNINDWKVDNVTYMGFLFTENTSFNQPLDKWNVGNVSDMTEMFDGATAFNQDISSWDISSLSAARDMFTGATGFSSENYDKLLLGWSTDTSATTSDGIDDIPTGIVFGAPSTTYCAGSSARNTLDTTYSWTISGDTTSDCSTGAFETTWETTVAGESITIPTTGSGYNYTIDWGDGTIENNQTGDATHSYVTAGTHTIRILGDFPRIYFNNSGDKDKILSIEQWGDIQWTIMARAFQGCANLVLNATDTPDLSQVTNMLSMFFEASSFVDNGGSIGTWNTANVQQMGFMFVRTPMNSNINDWKVDNVTYMGFMFTENTSFNQPLDKWNVGNVNDMTEMFDGATAFNQDISSWDISSLSTARDMFTGATSFSSENYDQLLIGWSTDSSGNPNDGVDDIPIGITFGAPPTIYCAGSAARTLLTSTPNNWAISGEIGNCLDGFITTWRTTSANESIEIPTHSGSTYNYTVDWGDGTIEYNQTGNATHTYATVGNHTVRILGDFPRIFFNNDYEEDNSTLLTNGSKDKILSIDQWGAIEWANMESAFQSCSNLVLNATDTPDLSNVQSLSFMFNSATALVDNGNAMNSWNVSTITDMIAMFSGAVNFNGVISNWNTINLINVSAMLAGASQFNQDVSSWDISSVGNMASMLIGATSFSSENYDKLLIGWSTDSSGDPNDGVDDIPIGITFGAPPTSYCEGSSSRNILASASNNWIISGDSGEDCSDAFITTWKTTSANESITIPTTGSGYDYTINWGDNTVDFNQTGDATHTYTSAGTHTIIIIGSFPRIFFDDTSVDKDKILTIEQWGTNQWTSMQSAFNGCSNLVLNATDSPDFSGVTNMNMSRMFRAATALVDNQNQIGNWNVSNVNNMYGTFAACSEFNEDISGWQVDNVTTFLQLFVDATKFNQNIGGWNTGSAVNMATIFTRAAAFNQDISGWNTSKATNMSNIFNGATSFNQDISDWDISSMNSVTNQSMTNMFTGATNFSSENYNKLLIGWSTDSSGNTSDGIDDIPTGITFGAPATSYCTGSSAKTILASAPNNWTISGDLGEDCSDAFITTWQTTGASESITIPTTGTGYDYTIDWGDGIVEQITTDASPSHNYAAANTYTITITGNFPRIYFDGIGDTTKILSIEQWGTIAWASMDSAFEGCSNLVLNATDTPDVSGATSIAEMFQNATVFVDNGGAMNSWNVSTITSMVSTFSNAETFNHDISNWDVSNVDNIGSMFVGATAFNQNIGGWNTSKVTDMVAMFANATAFNQDISGWDISSVTSMSSMFLGATGFSSENYDKLLLGWSTDTSATTSDGIDDIPTGIDFGAPPTNYCAGSSARNTLDTTYSWTISGDATADCSTGAFETTWETTVAGESITIPTTGSGYNYTIDWGDGTIETGQTGDATHSYATAGTHTIRILGDFPRIYFNNSGDKDKVLSIEQWGAIEWTNMELAFRGCSNLVLNATDTPNLSNATSMNSMFFGATTFVDNGGAMGSWDVSTITNMALVFAQAVNFDGAIGNWNVSNVTTMNAMFLGANTFNQDIGGWDTGEVINMGSIFQAATAFNQDIGAWDTSKAEQLSFAFGGATAFNQDIGGWDISSVNTTSASMQGILDGATAFSTENYDKLLIGWSTLDAGETQIPTNMTFGEPSTYCTGANARNELSTTFGWTFSNNATEDCSEAFITTWQTTTSNESIIIPTTGSGYSYTIDWGDGMIETGQTGDATHSYATAGTHTVRILGDFPRIYFNDAGDKDKIQTIEQWGTIAWTNMRDAFEGCSNVVLNATDTPNLTNVTDFIGMFRKATSFNDIGAAMGSWNVSSYSGSMVGMFSDAANFNGAIGSWNVSNVTAMQFMFNGAVSFNQDLSNWDISNLSGAEVMFDGATGFSSENYDQLLLGWSTDSSGNSSDGIDDIPTGLTLGAPPTSYCAGSAARNMLTNAPNNWTINGDTGEDCTSTYFITTWQTTSANESITIPTTGTGYNYTVDWGDGNSDSNRGGDTSHTYATAGTYTVAISGDFPRIDFGGNSPDRNKIHSIEQWGDIQWTSMQDAFRGCDNIVLNAIDIPDLSNVTSLASMFLSADAFVDNGGQIGNWDVSTITNMSSLFESTALNSNLNNWNTSNVENMSSLFLGVTEFNQPLNNWDVSKVTNMERMLAFTDAFNQDISGWNTGSVQNMKTMFESTDAFNQNIGGWNVSSVTDFERMFKNAIAFNQDLSTWDISSATNMSAMFNGTTAFSTASYDALLAGWSTDTSGNTSDGIDDIPPGVTFGAPPTNYCAGLVGRSILTSSLNNWTISGESTEVCSDFFITTWQTTTDNETITIPTTGSTYNYAIDWGDDSAGEENQTGDATHTYTTAGTYTITITGTFPRIFFNNMGDKDKILSIEQWGSIQWGNQGSAFYGCSNLVLNAIDAPDLSNTAFMSNMFRNATSFVDNGNQIGSWDVSNVSVFERMFDGAAAFNKDVSTWDISSTTNMTNMFTGATSFSNVNYDKLLIGWSTLDTGEIQIPTNVTFGAPPSNYCTSSAARTTLTSAPNNWIISGDTGENCANTYFITTWQTTTANENITIPTFSGETYNYTVDWGDGNVELNQTGDAVHTYASAGAHTVKILGTFPRIYFNDGGNKDKIQSIEQWGGIQWISMENAFEGCSNLVINATDQPDLSDVTDMTSMFQNATALADNGGAMANWDVSTINTMNSLFEGAAAFNQDLSAWDISGISTGTSMENMFTGATSFSSENYNNLLIGWITLVTGETQIPSGVSFGAPPVAYCFGLESRATLTDSPNNWTITGDVLDVCSDTSFITTWQTTTDNESITIPTTGSGYNYAVDWGDGTIEGNLTGSTSHTYATSGTYTVKVLGDFPRIYFNNGGSKDNILSIEQWGAIEWGDMIRAFRGCGNLVINATDVPDLSSTGSMLGMFQDASSLVDNGGAMGSWNTSTITAMQNLFRSATAFNENISSWNTGNVSNMGSMFRDATTFNRDIGNWDVSNVGNMLSMFNGATAFNQDLSTWDISSMTSVSNMFTGATSFSTANYDNLLIGWSTLDAGETQIPTSKTFGAPPTGYCAGLAARNILDTTYSWTISGDTTSDCSDAFITTWETTSANESITIPTTGSGYDYTIDWGDGTIENSQTGDATHSYTTAGIHTIRILGDFPRIYFNNLGDKDKIQSVEQWGSIAWTSMESAFYGCSNLVLNATDVPDLSGVTDMTSMFHGSASLVDNQDMIGTWNVMNVQTFNSIFNGAAAFNEDVSVWDISSSTNMAAMFTGATSFSSENYDQLLIGWATDSNGNSTDGVDDIPSGLTFGAPPVSYCVGSSARNTLDTTYSWTISGDTTSDCSTGAFETTWQTTVANESITIPTTEGGYDYTIDWGDGTIENNQTGDATHSYVTAGIHTIRILGDFPRIYFGNDGDKTKIITIEQWGAIEWSSMNNAFNGCSNLVINATDTPSLSDVSNTSLMFKNTDAFVDNGGELGNWDVSTVTDMNSMFSHAKAFNENIGNWNVSNVLDMENLFEDAESFNQDLSNWNVSKVQNMRGMFRESGFNRDISGWDVSNATDLRAMFFRNTIFNQDISGWNVSNAQLMSNMFSGTTSFNQDLSQWDISSITDMLSMFSGATGFSSENYDKLLLGWSTDTSATTSDGIDDIPTGITFSAPPTSYCVGSSARNTLDTTYSWTISGDTTSDCSTGAFETTWETTVADESITIPTTGSGYDYTIDWGDGTIENNQTGDATHSYVTAGTHTIRILGDFPRIYFNNSGDKDKVLSIEQWGSIAWTSMESAFFGCSNLVLNATDVPDLSGVTDMTSMFQGSASLVDNQDMIGTWNVINVQTFNSIFNGAAVFNEDVSVWDISSSTNMTAMFNGVISFSWENYDQLLIGWSTDSSGNSSDGIDDIPIGITFGAPPINYCLGSAARSTLTSVPYSWTISGDAGEDCPDSYFITTWQTTTNNESITIPTEGTGYNYTVDWGDGMIENNQTGDATHTYTTAGTHTVKISGDFPRIYFNNSGDRNKIFSIDQWGDIQWTTMARAFYGCTNLVLNATDTPDLSQVTIMLFMFHGTSSFADNGGSLGSWITDNVEAMGYVFSSSSMNSNINDWNVSNVIAMNNMFLGNTSFNQPLNNWNVDGVTNMTNMFHGATAFDQNISNWNTSSVTTMENMFLDATVFNQDLSNWNVSEVKNMSRMFEDAVSFNQDLSNWDVSKVENMLEMFRGAVLFNQDLSTWDVSNLSEATDMFTGATGFSSENYDKLLIGWSTDTSATISDGIDDIPTGITFGAPPTTYCTSSYARTILINAPNNWTITNDTADCSEAFITTWQTTTNNESITIPTTDSGYDYIIDWGDGNVDINQTGDATHSYATAGTYTVTITGTFPRIYFNNGGDKAKILSIEQWGDIIWTSMNNAFNGCSNLVINATDTPDLSGVTDMDFMFFQATSLVDNQDLIGTWDTSGVTTMASMFALTSAFNENIGGWNTSSVEFMAGMFNGATAFNQDIGGWDIGSLSNSFGGAFALITFLDITTSFSSENYDLLLTGWSTDTSGNPNDGVDDIPTGLSFGAPPVTYCDGATGRTELDTTYGWAIMGDNGENCTANQSPVSLSLDLNLFLQGPYNTSTGLMNDGLRSAGVIPTTSPYAGADTLINPSVLDVTGNDAIVDWVYVELRDKNDETNVLYASSALLQRDGDVVNMNDGITDLTIEAPNDSYYVSVSHRNHIAIITDTTVSLSETKAVIDFMNSSASVKGGSLAVEEVASGVFALFAGDANGNGSVQTTDINPIIQAIGILGYNVNDINMNGAVQTTDTPIARSLIGKIKQF